MSYILDALRRAETDRARERGKVPGVHDPAPAGATVPASEGADRRRGAWIAGGVVAVLAVSAVGWALKDHGDPPAMVASAGPANGATGTASTPIPPSAVPDALPATAQPGPPSTALPTPAPTAPPATAPIATITPPRELTPPPALPSTSRPVGAPGVSAVTTAPTPAMAAPTATTATTSRIYEASELPEDVRRALPSLNIGGAMYSDTPSARLLIVNGQVAHEGDPVGKGLVLEQIRLKTAVLAFRGYRYLVTY